LVLLAKYGGQICGKVGLAVGSIVGDLLVVGARVGLLIKSEQKSVERVIKGVEGK